MLSATRLNVLREVVAHGSFSAAADALSYSQSAVSQSIATLEGGSMARAAFGDDVVDHYLNYARTEQGLFDRVVTDWERQRLYERG